MNKSKFTEQQIAFALQQAESGTQVAEVCRKMDIAEATSYRWKQLYGGLMPSEVKKLRQLEEENTRLRRVASSRWASQLYDDTSVEEAHIRVSRRRCQGGLRYLTNSAPERLYT
jgi:putative transposase